MSYRVGERPFLAMHNAYYPPGGGHPRPTESPLTSADFVTINIAGR